MDSHRFIDRDEPDTWYAKQEFRLLLHRLRGLPPAERSKLRGLFAEELRNDVPEAESRWALSAATDEPPDTWSAKQEFRLLMRRLRGLPAADRGRLQGVFTEEMLAHPLIVETSHGPISFVLLSEMAAGRARSLFERQPDTIAWIDGFEPGRVFWDIGANIGVYALYAARRGDTKVVAFEPAAVNYFILSANCEMNRFEGRMDCLLTGISDGTSIDRIGVTQFVPGDSFSFAGKPRHAEGARQAAFMVSIDQLVEQYGVPCPTYIKIDVPALTAQIITGGARTLRRPEMRELHVEVNDKTRSGRTIATMLREVGYTERARHAHGNTADVTFVRR
jgi:FkbM family methyltransferase